MAPSSKKKRGTENNAEEGIPLDETKKKSFEKKVKAIKKNVSHLTRNRKSPFCNFHVFDFVSLSLKFKKCQYLF